MQQLRSSPRKRGPSGVQLDALPMVSPPVYGGRAGPRVAPLARPARGKLPAGRGAATAPRCNRPLHRFAVPLPRCAGEDQKTWVPALAASRLSFAVAGMSGFQ